VPVGKLDVIRVVLIPHVLHVKEDTYWLEVHALQAVLQDRLLYLEHVKIVQILVEIALDP